VAEVKARACEILLEYRLNNKSLTGKNDKSKDTVLNRIHVAVPTPRDNKKRVPFIPEGLKNKEANFEFNEETLEKKIINNKVKEMIEKNGGDSVFYVPDRTHFILANEDWRNDIMPEIMDGKNVFDFVDPEIDEKLARIEEEEDQIMEKHYQSKAFENENDDDDDALDEDLIEAHEKMMINKEKIRQQHQLVVASQLPKSVRGLTETEELMQKIRWDKGELSKQFLSQKTKRQDYLKKRKQSNNSSMVKSKKDESMDEDIMDLDDEEYANKVKILESKKKDEAQKKLVTERMQRKIHKKMFHNKAKIDVSDRRVNTKLPRHLNSGHRGIGKTDYR